MDDEDKKRWCMMMCAAFLFSSCRRRRMMRNMMLLLLLKQYYFRRQLSLLSAMTVAQVIRRQTRRQKPRIWVIPRPQSWFLDILESGDDEQFRESFGVSRGTFNFISRLVGEEIKRKDTTFRLAIPVDKRVAISLWRLATGESYKKLGIQFGIGKASAVNAFTEFLDALCAKLDNFVKFPENRVAIYDNIAKMSSFTNFPQAFGAVGGVAIERKAPDRSPIVLQGIVDAEFNFLDVYVGQAGNANYGEVFEASTIHEKLHNETLSYCSRNIGHCDIGPVLLGGHSYPLSHFLMTPYDESASLNEKQQVYNSEVSKGLSMLDQTFGLLMTRWGCLRRRMEDDREKVGKIMQSCCILHNICNDQNDVLVNELDALPKQPHRDVVESDRVNGIREVISNHLYTMARV